MPHEVIDAMLDAELPKLRTALTKRAGLLIVTVFVLTEVLVFLR